MTIFGPRVREPGDLAAIFRAQFNSHLDHPSVDVGDGVVAEDDLSADDQVLANDFAGQVGFERGNADLRLLPDRDLADVLLVNLGHSVHDFGIADLEDSLVADALARPDVNARDLPLDLEAHFGRLEIGTRERQAGLRLHHLGFGDLDVGRAYCLDRGEICLVLIDRFACLFVFEGLIVEVLFRASRPFQQDRRSAQVRSAAQPRLPIA